MKKRRKAKERNLLMPNKPIFLLSPSEYKLAEVLGKASVTSNIPEQKGADILAVTRAGLMGFQRKEVPNDFLSSISDGRMARELTLLFKSCKYTRLICEGKFKYWYDGHVVTGRIDKKKKMPTTSRYTRSQIEGIIFDVQQVIGIIVDYTEDLDDTARYLIHTVELMNKKSHLGLYTRPSAQGAWYVPTAKDIHLYLLQSFPGIGPATADKIIEHFGGDIPLKWSCELEELMEVSGLTKERAHSMYHALQSGVYEYKSSSSSRAKAAPRSTAGTKDLHSRLSDLRQRFTK